MDKHVKLKGAKKSANSEEFRRLMNVQMGEDPCFMEEKRSDPAAEERRREVDWKIARRRNCI
jgi:hypothetical protein